MEKFNLIAQRLNQLTFISSIIGGFAISVTSTMLVCVIGWSMAAFRLHILSANNNIEKLEKLGMTIDVLSQYLGLLFFASIFLFFISLGLSGWNISRKVGIITTLIALLSTIAGGLVIVPFLGMNL